MQKLKFLVIFIFGLFSLCFAEDITITTYYPSPYGSYNDLQSNKLAVGDTNGDGNLTVADLPNRDGDIRLKAQAGNPTAWAAGATGQFAYSSTQDSLYHYNGSSWVGAGGGGCYVDYGLAEGLSVGASCGAGFTVKKSAGSWGGCFYTDGFGSLSHFRPASGGCISGWDSRALGTAYVCCQ